MGSARFKHRSLWQVVAALGILAVLVLSVALGRGWRPGSEPVPSGSETCPPRTLCNEAAAVEAALAEMPVGFQPGRVVARMLTMGQALAWANMSVDDEAYAAKPVWLVGVSGPHLTVESALGEVSPGGYPEPVAGSWFIVVASGGGVAAYGGLAAEHEPKGPKLSSIEQLPSLQLPVEPPTEIPTVTPGPSPTPGLPPWP